MEAADMGDKDAQYELGCRLRVEVSFHVHRIVHVSILVQEMVYLIDKH